MKPFSKKFYQKAKTREQRIAEIQKMPYSAFERLLIKCFKMGKSSSPNFINRDLDEDMDWLMINLDLTKDYKTMLPVQASGLLEKRGYRLMDINGGASGTTIMLNFSK